MNKNSIHGNSSAGTRDNYGTIESNQTAMITPYTSRPEAEPSGAAMSYDGNAAAMMSGGRGMQQHYQTLSSGSVMPQPHSGPAPIPSELNPPVRHAQA